MWQRVCAVWGLVCLLAGLFAGQTSAQQDVVWVQVEAQPSLSAATERAQAYAAELPDVNGFALRGGWYAVALGPYVRADANQVLRVYRAEGIIPRDSFIARSADFAQQFWPVGANLLDRGSIVPQPTGQGAAQTPAQAAQRPEPQAEVAPQPPAADETPVEAQRSERTLSRAEREDLQVALQWAGTYDGAIDGDFGRGTRNAMAAWQALKGFDVTGILTTAQRAALLGDYNAVLDGTGFEIVRDETAGIEIGLPTAVVGFEKYEYPFAHYTATAETDAMVLLISQAGDQTTLFGLYDIMQTLDIVPLDGPRERTARSFSITGSDARRVSETRVRLENGQIKGFTLVWPSGDEPRRKRLLEEMEASLQPFGRTIPPGAGSEEQAIDLVSGLAVRTPRLSRSGFFVDRQGTVMTTAEATEGCGRITLDGDTEAAVIATDARRGVSILRPGTPLAPLDIARFSAADPRLGSEVAAAGYSYEGVLGAPSMTFGTLRDLRGLAGEPDQARLALETLAGDAGGPILDAGGGVLGMLLPAPSGGRTLPGDVSLALGREALQEVLASAGLAAGLTDSSAAIDPVDLTAAATGMTVLVSCWD